METRVSDLGSGPYLMDGLNMAWSISEEQTDIPHVEL